MTQTEGDWASLEGRLETLKRELDALQIHVMSAQAPWYKQVPVIVSVLISVAALAFSFWTANRGEERLNRQEEHQARSELRGLVQRLQEIPREEVELQSRYKDGSHRADSVAAAFSAEKQVIARQAAELIADLDGEVAAPEYYSVVGALVESGQPGGVDSLIRRGLEEATDAQSAAVLHRWLARMRFDTGNEAGGRAAFRDALTVFERYPHPDRAWVNAIQGQTHTLWAEEEAEAGKCEAAWRHITLAQRVPGYEDSAAPAATYVESFCPRRR